MTPANPVEGLQMTEIELLVAAAIGEKAGGGRWKTLKSTDGAENEGARDKESFKIKSHL